MIYMLLKMLNQLVYKKGEINYDNLCDIWPDNDDNERRIFIDFMLSCEFCFELENEEDKHKNFLSRKFIVPQLLSPKKDYIEEYATHFHLEEQKTKDYRFLPSVYIQRFIVRANKFAKVRDMWPSGIMLRYEAEKSYAIMERKVTKRQRPSRYVTPKMQQTCGKRFLRSWQRQKENC